MKSYSRELKMENPKQSILSSDQIADCTDGIPSSTKNYDSVYNAKNTEMYMYAIENVNLIPEAAKVWVDFHFQVFNEGDFDEDFIKASVVDFLNQEKCTELRDVLNFILPIFNMDEFDTEIMNSPYAKSDETIPSFLKEDPGYLRMVMKAFPNIWGPQYEGEDIEKLLKASQVARILQISESQVRQLALSGELQFIRSQGETGHYRFKHEWLLNYQNDCDDSSPEKLKVV
jgi:hypothetical protein